jgi:hypothetical protein
MDKHKSKNILVDSEKKHKNRKKYYYSESSSENSYSDCCECKKNSKNYNNINIVLSGLNAMQGPKGEKGDKGDKGPIGLTGSIGPSVNNKTILCFSTNQIVNNGDYIGQGFSSNCLVKNTLLIPYNCIIDSICFSIRELNNNIPYYATVIVNGKSTNVNCIISNSISSYNTCSLPLKKLDLITILINFSSGEIKSGVTVTLTLNIM